MIQVIDKIDDKIDLIEMKNDDITENVKNEKCPL